MFSDDFGHELGQIATLVDSNDNRFQCLVEKMNANVYLTRGWTALRDFYNIRIGAWVVLIYAGSSEFGLIVQDRFLQVIPPPLFVPPMRFVIDMTTIPSYFINNVPGAMQNLPCRHDPHFLHLCHDKKLTYYDISTGFLVRILQDPFSPLFLYFTGFVDIWISNFNLCRCCLMMVLASTLLMKSQPL
jgi:hypothetical protein